MGIAYPLLNGAWLILVALYHTVVHSPMILLIIAGAYLATRTRHETVRR